MLSSTVLIGSSAQLVSISCVTPNSNGLLFLINLTVHFLLKILHIHSHLFSFDYRISFPFDYNLWVLHTVVYWRPMAPTLGLPFWFDIWRRHFVYGCFWFVSVLNIDDLFKSWNPLFYDLVFLIKLHQILFLRYRALCFLDCVKKLQIFLVQIVGFWNAVVQIYSRKVVDVVHDYWIRVHVAS